MSKHRPPNTDASQMEKAEGDRDSLSPDVRDAGNLSEASAAAEEADGTPSNLRKDPDEWTTGEESMTDAQRSYLQTLSDEADEPFDSTLTKAEASKRIDALRRKTGRGITR